MTMATTISVENVSKRFGSHVALDDLSLDVSGGELVIVLGPSGCGKTTLLRTIQDLTSLIAVEYC